MTETTTVFKMILTDQWDVEISKVVGEIAISFAQLEHALWVLPKRIKKLDLDEWAGIAGKVPIPTRCQQIRESFARKRMNQDQEAELDSLLKDVERVNENRNSVVHGRWGCKKKRGKISSLHRFWRDRDQGVVIADLKILRDDIRTTRDRLLHFVSPR
jgi:hypothetical protein